MFGNWQNLGPCAQTQGPSENRDGVQGISGLTKEELAQEFLKIGEKSFRAIQVWDWLFKKVVNSFREMANIPKQLRGFLDSSFHFSTLEIKDILVSQDGTRKFLFQLKDGLLIESVVIPEKDHLTLCVSSQVGCAMGCLFCLTGSQGFKRNLSTSEIIDQILEVKRHIPRKPPLTNIVFMGMGEPLLNLKSLSKAIQIILDPEALGFSHRRVTVSTSGIIPGIKALAQGPSINLAVSLNATNDELRSKLMPINKKYPLRELINTLREFPLPKGRRITFEYVVIHQVNDQPSHAHELVSLLKGIPSKVNLIPLNELPHSGLKEPSEGRVLQIQEILLNHHVTAIIRKSKGRDIMAACGQLAGSKTQC